MLDEADVVAGALAWTCVVASNASMLRPSIVLVALSLLGPGTVGANPKKASSPTSTAGGAEAEALAEAQRRMPESARDLQRVLGLVGTLVELPAAEAKLMDELVAASQTDDAEQAEKLWADLVQAYAKRSLEPDADLLLAHLLLHAYLLPDAQFAAQAKILAAHNSIRARITDQRRALEAELSKNAKAETFQVAALELVPGSDRVAPTLRTAAAGKLSRAEVQRYLAGLDKQLTWFSSAMNLRMMQIQTQMQQDSRTFQTISNVMKVRHDTAKAMIQDVRG